MITYRNCQEDQHKFKPLSLNKAVSRLAIVIRYSISVMCYVYHQVGRQVSRQVMIYIMYFMYYSITYLCIMCYVHSRSCSILLIYSNIQKKYVVEVARYLVHSILIASRRVEVVVRITDQRQRCFGSYDFYNLYMYRQKLK